ncbi:Dolichyl-diphosphooligosaccharide--protein glycosyltransferase subunit 2 [Glycine max]|nr:Dolichyl-diphosphooligosaccharide--protein glycosyltransferase subunit 2 [Glycine max]
MPRTSSIKISIPLILSLPERVYSLTKKGHLKKLRFSFQLTTPHGHVFKPNQAFFKLRHLKHVQFTCSDLNQGNITKWRKQEGDKFSWFFESWRWNSINDYAESLFQLADVVAIEVTGGPKVSFHPGRESTQIGNQINITTMGEVTCFLFQILALRRLNNNYALDFAVDICSRLCS